METFRSIKIIHDIKDRMDFLFLAEFFHFCGLYVGEGIAFMPDSFEETDSRCFDIFISIDKYEEFPEYEENKEKYKCYLNLLNEVERFVCLRDIFEDECIAGCHKDRMDLYSGGGTLTGKKNVLRECMDRCLKELGADEEERTVWVDLIEVYVNHNIMLYSSSLQYYQHSPAVAIQEAANNMMSAYDSLEQKYPKGNVKKRKEDRLIDAEYAEYARIWCAVKANLGFAYQRKTLFFSPQELAKEAEQLYQNYPDFSNAIVLQGLCYENSRDKANEAIAIFLQALEKDRLNCYSTAIYYWLGKRYEAYDSRQEEAEYYYRMAYEKKKKFRNIYKLAMYAEQRKDYRQAEKYYLQIISALRQKREVGMEDPLELEYEFKAYKHMCVMYFRKCRDITVKYRKTIEYADKAIEVREQGVEKSDLYVYLYGEGKADEYRTLSRGRMDLEYIYRVLFLTYNELQEHDLARKYREKLQTYV